MAHNNKNSFWGILILILFGFVLASCAAGPREDKGVQEAVDVLEGAEEPAEEPAEETAEAEDVDEELTDDEEITEEVVEESADEEPAAEESTAEADAEEDQLEPLAEDDLIDEEEPAQEEPAAIAETEPISPAEPAPVAPPAAPSVNITQIEYRANDRGGTVVITTNQVATYTTRGNADTNQFVIEIPNSYLADRLKRPYIMKDFEGAFAAINAYQTPGATISRIVIQLRSSGEPAVQQEGKNIFILPSTVNLAQGGSVADQQVAAEIGGGDEGDDSETYDVKAAAQHEKALGARTLDEFLTDSNRFFGSRMSISVKDADIRDVINFIADHAGLNVVLADDVEGKITLKLRQVPWDQAMIMVMRAKNLGYIRQGNVLRISQLASLQKESAEAKSIVEAQKGLAPLKVKVIPLSYAAVKEMVEQVKNFLTPNRGRAVGDDRTSSLIVTDTADVLMKVERLVRELDIPPTQVMIEGKIVEATEKFTRSVGLNWSLNGTAEEISQSGGVNNSPLRMRGAIGFSPVDTSNLTTFPSSFSLSVGRMRFLGNLSALLALAERDNLLKVISSPRVVTMNQHKAVITNTGESISIKETRDLASTSTTPVVTRIAERTPFKLELSVTPQITAEGSVILDVEMIREFPGVEEDTATKARANNSRKANTKVLVQNAETAVVGGVYQSDESNTTSRFPGLSKVPLIGWLFKSEAEERVKSELLLFLTPRILNPELQQAK